MARRRASTRGMTLVELAIVVVIVAVLATIAVVGYRRYRTAARMSEATTMVSSIRAAQAEHKHETGLFANVSKGMDQFHPQAKPTNKVYAWGTECTACNDPHGWERLKVEVPGPVMYGYATVAGVGAVPTGEGLDDGLHMAKPEQPPASTDPFFVVVARGDTDGDGKSCTVVANSYSNQLVVTNEGE